MVRETGNGPCFRVIILRPLSGGRYPRQDVPTGRGEVASRNLRLPFNDTTKNISAVHRFDFKGCCILSTHLLLISGERYKDDWISNSRSVAWATRH